jgi:hypothetical protein
MQTYEITCCIHCHQANGSTRTDADGCQCIEATCGHIIGPDTDDLPPCEVEGFCEHCCTCEPED